jgi:hypothetical protein
MPAFAGVVAAGSQEKQFHGAAKESVEPAWARQERSLEFTRDRAAGRLAVIMAFEGRFANAGDRAVRSWSDF